LLKNSAINGYLLIIKSLFEVYYKYDGRMIGVL